MPSATWFNLDATKRARIVDAALGEFGARGFSSGSLNVIAREAGIAKGSLFQYFGDKRAMYAHVCDVCSRRVRDEFTRSMLVRAEDHHDLFAFLRAVFPDWVDYFTSHPAERAIVFAASFEVDPEARRAVRDVLNRHLLDVLRPLVDAAVAAGQIRPGASVDHLLAMLVMLIPHLATAPFDTGLDPVLHMAEREGLELEAAVTGFVDALEGGFARPPGARPAADLAAAVASTAEAIGVTV